MRCLTRRTIRWNAKTQPALANEGKTQFLPQSVDFATTRVTKKTGRDLAVVVYDDDGITIYFADNPNNADDYELGIAFGKGEAAKGK